MLPSDLVLYAMGKTYDQVLSNISTALASTTIIVIRRELPTSLLPVADLSQQMRKQYLGLSLLWN